MEVETVMSELVDAIEKQTAAIENMNALLHNDLAGTQASSVFDANISHAVSSQSREFWGPESGCCGWTDYEPAAEEEVQGATPVRAQGSVGRMCSLRIPVDAPVEVPAKVSQLPLPLVVSAKMAMAEKQ